MKHKILILRVNNVGQTQELIVVEQATKRTAKAALRYQKQTENINKKIHAVGVIAKSVDDQLTRISNVDNREFETLTNVIDGQVNLSKQAVDLDKQWARMVDHQRAELDQLKDVNESLKAAHQNKLSAITALHDLADENHEQYVAELTTIEEQLERINAQITAFNTKEYMAQITILVSALNAQLAKEKQAHMEQAEKINERMVELRTATKAMLISAGHYTKIMQTIDAKVKYIAERVDLLDVNVSHINAVSDNITEADIMTLFSTFDKPQETPEDDTVETHGEPDEIESDEQHDVDLPEEDPVSHDDDKDDAPSESDIAPRSAKQHGDETKSKSTKWKFWTK